MIGNQANAPGISDRTGAKCVPPSRFCDLVMKGGITSGVVYPHGVTILSQAFTFKNIGGTSAGAIAAAAAAAAELGREQGGFDRLKSLPDFLSAPSSTGKGTNLLGFFQPQPKTRPIFRLGMAYLEGARLKFLALLLYEQAWVAFLAAIPSLLLIASAWMNATGWLLAVCIFCGVILLALCEGLAMILALAFRVVSSLPSNFYGLCTGMETNVGNPSASKPLTPWLADYLNEVAGRPLNSGPLTFEHLWATRDPDAPRLINLEMMTTNLTHGRPYRLPFREDDVVKENRLFYFRPDDFQKLFPANIIDWMVKHPRALGEREDESRRNQLTALGFYPLPSPADLPVVVAVRMSLSFPILLSAIPLYAFDYSPNRKALIPERCWFSDGGICSNFPIHFFDSPIPRWPTLSMDLLEKPRGTSMAELKTPWMVQRNSDGIKERWNRFEYDEEVAADGKTIISTEKSSWGKLAGFVWAMVATMQNWSDNTQSRLPGYRDRIAHIGLTPEEGGLNLNMPPDRIKNLTQRGEAAGQEFVSRFGYPATHSEMNWSNHRWLRMRSMLSSFDEMLAKFERSCAQPQTGDIPYDQWVQQSATVPPPSYPWSNQAQQESAQKAIDDLRSEARRLIMTGLKGSPLSKGAPAPSPELRLRTRI